MTFNSNSGRRKKGWELPADHTPPLWLAETYGGFTDLQNNPIYRYVRVFGHLPKERLLDLDLTLVEPREIIEGYLAARTPTGRFRYLRRGILDAINTFHRTLNSAQGSPRQDPSEVHIAARHIEKWLQIATSLWLCGLSFGFMGTPFELIVGFVFLMLVTIPLRGPLSHYPRPNPDKFKKWVYLRSLQIREIYMEVQE